MKKRYIPFALIFLMSVAVYILLFHKNKTLKFIPENADLVVLIDMKKVRRQYIYDWLMHPSQWSKSSKNNNETVSFRNSGVKIPDFLQIFHLKNSKFSNYYTILELEDFQKFCTLLKKQQFVNKGIQGCVKDNIVVYVNKKYAVVGTSSDEFAEISDFLSKKNVDKNQNADRFMKGSLGSLSFISGKNVQNFSINLKDDEIEIKNEENSTNFQSLISDLNRKTQFLEAELDSENIRKISSFFKENIADSASVNHLKMSADLAEVNDTIISYGYDDNFNEIEKVSYQKIIQPNYEILLQTSDPNKTWSYFQNKKWINAQNQFTAIPFQPNLIYNNKNEVYIKSTGRSVKHDFKKQNFIFLKNNHLLYSSLKTLVGSHSKLVKDIDYIFYGNKSQDYLVKIKLKKNELPLLLRF